jgi:MtaA/CmuA family methyltransferase
MNSRERVEAVLRGTVPDRVPVCLHNFLLATRESGIPLERYLTDACATADAHLHALDRYGHDCVLVDLDTTMLAEAMGARRDCAPGQPGHLGGPAIGDLSEVGRLRVVDPERDGRIPVLLEAVHRLAEAVGREVAIRGNADQAAFSLASLLRGQSLFMMDLATQPDDPAIRDLLDVCHQSHLAVHRALIRAGAHFTSLGDSPAGPDMISPRMFTAFAQPCQERLVRELAAEGIFTVIHVCGNTSAILDRFATYPNCGFELDYKTDAVRAKGTVGAGHVLFGNIDPSAIIASGTPEQVRTATADLIRIWKPGGRFILNAGCAIPDCTPSENVHALLDAAHQFGSYSG